MKKYSTADYTNHRLTVKGDAYTSIYELYKPDTIIHGLTVVVVAGHTVVFGDWGKWLFGIPFSPLDKNGVSMGYWNEKASIQSTQQVERYSEADTAAAIQTILDTKSEEEFGQEVYTFFENILKNKIHENERDYLRYVEENCPAEFSYEVIPFKYATHDWLKVVYDGMNRIVELYSSNNFSIVINGE